MTDMQPQGEPGRDFGDDRGHEESDVSVRGILGFAVGLVALGVAIQFVLGLAMQHYARRETREQAKRPPQFAVDVRPPAPRLQGNPAADLAEMKREELDRLNTYGWVDRPQGVARIPVERAMELLARKGLPRIEESGSSTPASDIEKRVEADAKSGAEPAPKAKEAP